jgi:mannosyl-oligosaccharide glucosidase
VFNSVNTKSFEAASTFSSPPSPPRRFGLDTTMADHAPRRLTFRRILSTLLAALLVTGATAEAPSETDSILLNEIARASNQSLLWGPYRPNVYFGVKPRIPNSFFAGLMWAGVNNFKAFQHSTSNTCLNG